MKSKRKEIITISLLVILVLVIIIGTSYAAFLYTGVGSIENSITTGAITMKYTETSNGITLNGALPTTDKTGMVRLNPGEYFDFNISSTITGNTNINYEISAKKEDGNTIDGKYIKLYLTRIKDDGTEDGLMSPETYNEESTSNDYTGRPTGEMSLYTSSMNSSESNNYRLRMYVDEGYNPQGDGGGLTFTVKINVYGKAGDKYLPETAKTILVANELQEEKTNMFDYASNGSYIDMDTYEEKNNPEYITNGLYSSEDEDGTSYYFRGNVDNNNVQFGTYDNDYYVYQSGRNYYQSEMSCREAGNSSCTQVKLASAGDKMYWKIVRINGDGSLRLIYNGTSATPDYSDLIHSDLVGFSPYSLEVDLPKYGGYTYDRDINETDSFVKKEVDTWYKNTLGSNSSYDSKISSGRFCSDGSGFDGTFFASYNRLAKAEGLTSTSNNPTLKCPTTTENYGGSYRLKVGLITADELVLAGESLNIGGNSYLIQSTRDYRYWSMTPSMLLTGNILHAWAAFGSDFGYSLAGSSLGIRPVINVSTSGDFNSGDGSSSNPYVIE